MAPRPAAKALLLENNGSGQSAVPTLLVDPGRLVLLSSGMARHILSALAKKPLCPKDIARELGEHEQKIYYHVRRLAAAGLIRELRKEKRLGMTAHIFQLAAPAMTAKLAETDGEAVAVAGATDPLTAEFFEPFISKGALNALVIVGDTYSHGPYDMYATEGVHAFDLGAMIGRMLLRPAFPLQRLDTETPPHEVSNNHLILIGHPQTNVFIDKMVPQLPVTFDEKDDWTIVSHASGVKYRDPREGVIIKMKSPFNPEKRALLLGGHTRGTKAAILACTKFLPDLISHIKDLDTFSVVVKGFDKDSDGVIDSVKFME